MSTFSKDQVKTQYIGMKRRFADTVFVYKMYVLLTLASVGLLGYFGIYKTILVIKEKIAIEKQLTTINASLQSNLGNFEKVQNDVLTVRSLIKDLDNFMPSTAATEEYIAQLSDAVSSSGFILRRTGAAYVSNKSGTTVIALSAKADGPGDPVALIKNIENLKRITTVKTFSYTLNTHASIKGDGDASITLEIYKSD